MLAPLLQLWLIIQSLWLLQNPQPAAKASVEFARDIQPILERRCQPCHFPGGVMHAKLPFDRGETIDQLGTRLFTRIKKEEERELIRKYLARGR